MQRFWLYFFIGGFTGGVLLRSFFDLGLAFAGFLLLLGVVVALAALVSLPQHRRVSVLGGLVLVGASLGVLRFDFADERPGVPALDERIGGQVAFEGVIVDEPDVRENSQRLTVAIDAVGDERLDKTAKALVVADLYPEVSYGDRIEARGNLKLPEGFESDTGRYFDYPAYLAKDDIYYQVNFAAVSVESEGHGNPVRRWLFAIKGAFLESMAHTLPEPQASLAGGLIVGAKQSLGQEWLEAFRTTGIIHIVVLSGYNVTIVAEAIMRSAAVLLPRAAALSFGAISIVLFALLTGASATIVRASIMALLVVVARATGKTYHMVYALFFAGFLMLVHNPMLLVFDPGFQLSFLATLGLIWLAPKVEEWLGFLPSKLQLREFATATIATQLFVLPLLLYMTGEFSVAALPVNLLVLITVPMAMLFGFLAGVVGLASTLIAMPLAFLAYLLLSYQLSVVELFDALSFASVGVGLVPFFVVVLAYAAYAVALLLFKSKPPRLAPERSSVEV